LALVRQDKDSCSGPNWKANRIGRANRTIVAGSLKKKDDQPEHFYTGVNMRCGGGDLRPYALGYLNRSGSVDVYSRNRTPSGSGLRIVLEA